MSRLPAAIWLTFAPCAAVGFDYASFLMARHVPTGFWAVVAIAYVIVGAALWPRAEEVVLGVDS